MPITWPHTNHARPHLRLWCVAQGAVRLAAIHDVADVVLAVCVRAIPVTWSPVHGELRGEGADEPSKLLLRGDDCGVWAGFHGRLGLGHTAQGASNLAGINDVGRVILAVRIGAMPVTLSHWRRSVDIHDHLHAHDALHTLHGLHPLHGLHALHARHARTSGNLTLGRRGLGATALGAYGLAAVDTVGVVDALRVWAAPVAWPCGRSASAALLAIHTAAVDKRFGEVGVIVALWIGALPITPRGIRHEAKARFARCFRTRGATSRPPAHPG
mmetsp:Transcript_60650/g.141295  ORF Transcript_60650/g.141295 Transcript_60650/m.141295 type:complete len:271 (-) Transcript_60650:2-814(-)